MWVNIFAIFEICAIIPCSKNRRVLKIHSHRNIALFPVSLAARATPNCISKYFLCSTCLRFGANSSQSVVCIISLEHFLPVSRIAEQYMQIPPPHSGRRTEDTSSVYAERCARSLKYARSKKNKHRIFLTGKKIKINTQAFIVACKQMQMKRESANLLYMPTRRFPVYTHTRHYHVV